MSSDEECESDYHSDIDWDSDAKDEVDGDVSPSPSNNNITGRRSKLKIDEQDRDKRKVVSEETDDDEQKKLHEGASALLNLAGFLFDQSRERAGSLIASTGKEENGQAKAGMQHKKRIINKGKPPKTPDHQEEAEGAVKRTPSKSKRKNAGSNAKYDNDEYSLGKSSGKARPSLLSSNAKRRKTQPLKSPSGKPGRKVSKALPKVKPAMSRVNNGHKAVKKKSVESKKLKLSKTFGKKAATVMKSVNGFLDESKKSSGKDALVKNGLSKRASVSASKMKGPKESERAAVEERAVIGNSNTSPTLHTADNELSKSSIPADFDKAEPDHALAQLANNNNNNNNNNDIKGAVATDKPGLPTASGDAPVHMKTESGMKDQAVLSRHTPPPTITPLTHGSSHKSPHFTRFSKKKSAKS